MRISNTSDMDCTMEDVEDNNDAIWLDDGTCVKDSSTAKNHEQSIDINESSAGTERDMLSERFVINRISLEDYHQLGRKYAEDALRQLRKTQDFQRWEQKCSMCGACWYEGQYGQHCVECGRSPMLKLCPICDGRCGQVWKRDVQMSHQFHEAHWNGECHLPQTEQMALLIRKSEPTEDSFLQAISDL